MTATQGVIVIILSVLICLIFFSFIYALVYPYATKTNKKLKNDRNESELDDQELSLLGKNILVVVESPFAGKTPEEIEQNIRYARACLADCLRRGEYPFASHLLYTQTGVLRDGVPEERQLGIEAGLTWGECADKTVVYGDLGISAGMARGIKRAKEACREVEFRSLPDFGAITITNEPLKF